MKTVKYRHLKWSDYAICRFLFQDVFALSEFPSFVLAWSDRMEGGSWVATYKGSIVGFALVNRADKLTYICIHEDFQGSGLGSALLTKVIDSTDMRALWLDTAGDERLVPWYARFGFQVVDRVIDGDEFLGASMVLRRRCKHSGFN